MASWLLLLKEGLGVSGGLVTGLVSSGSDGAKGWDFILEMDTPTTIEKNYVDQNGIL